MFTPLRSSFTLIDGRDPGAGVAKSRISLIAGAVLLGLCPFFLPAQQRITFSVDGAVYRADLNWIIKHNGVESIGKTDHTLDKSRDASFDLVIFFSFIGDSIPADDGVVWGFRFAQNGGVISPSANDKRSRSLKQFQRFQVSGPGKASLAIRPMVWRRNAGNQFETIGEAPLITLNFVIEESLANLPSVSTKTATADSTPRKNPPQPLPKTLPDPQESDKENEAEAFNQAANVADSTLKIKAFIDFVDKYAKEKPESKLVATAIRNIPLGASLPEVKRNGTYSYTLSYAVNPVVDTSSVRGWDWELSSTAYGEYRLTLNDLGDSAHSIRIADLGKNAPYNRPRELRPFDKIRVTLEGETSDSFRLKLQGGVPPFIVFLSQNKIQRERYVLNQTDTIWSISKSSCAMCKNGAHTLEVYNSDFSTLLLRAEGAVHIRRYSLFFLALYGVIALLVVGLLYKPLFKAWQRYAYQRKLREIEAWERLDGNDNPNGI